MTTRSDAWLETAKRDATAFQAGRNGNNAGDATTTLSERMWAEVNRDRGDNPKQELSSFVATLSDLSVEAIGRESDYYAFLAGIVQGYADMMPTKL